MSSKLLHAAVLVFSASIIGCKGPESVGPRVGPPSPLADRSVPTMIKFSEQVRFTIPAGTCGLTTTVVGTGVIDFVVHSVAHPDGTFNPSPMNTHVHGTAVGEDGSQYVFDRQNNAHLADDTGAATLPFTFTGVDKFNLVGAGNAPDVHVMQRFTIRINEDASSTLLKFEVRGDLACDPI